MKLSLVDIKRFLAQADPQQVVGDPMTSSYCLVAETLKWAYPKSKPHVYPGNEAAEIKIGLKWANVELTPDITAIANQFDRIRKENVTRSELEGYMPELFKEEANG